ncbi:MAG: hypothetical protein E4H20_04655 [Spirochaetales bacterium]|nr:MAG: hypothetical protein E4H20_04655 [Spirochaetales bacterium]
MIKYGRLILAEIPATEGARRRRELLQEGRDKRASEVDGFNEKFNRRGVRAAVREMEEFEDRKRFASERDVKVSLAGLDLPPSNPETVKADSV